MFSPLLNRSYQLSRVASMSGTQPEPCSVSTNRSSGWRSNTPEKIRCHSDRCENQATSMMNMAAADLYQP